MRVRTREMEGQRYPRFYGLAWQDYAQDEVVMYMIPFNWIAWLFRETYFRLLRTPRTCQAEPWEAGYRKGKFDGKQQMLAEVSRNEKAAFRKGYQKALDDLVAHSDAEAAKWRREREEREKGC